VASEPAILTCLAGGMIRRCNVPWVAEKELTLNDDLLEHGRVNESGMAKTINLFLIMSTLIRRESQLPQSRIILDQQFY
jgi:hypothetical protein